MRGLTRLGCSIVALTLLASGANATTRSSFLTVDGVASITAPTSNAGQTYTVTLGASPSFTLAGNTYAITDLIGFYVLSDDLDFTPLSAFSAIASPGPFSDDSSNSGLGAIGGWRSNPNVGLTPGQSLAFTLPAAFPLADIDRIGFHVRVSGTFPGTSGNTGNITGPIPAPGAVALFACGGLVAVRRRRA